MKTDTSELELKINSSNESNSQDLQKLVGHSIRISDHLHNRLTKHIQILKYATDQNCSKQTWAQEAFEEKWEQEQAQFFEGPSTDKHLHVKISQDLNSKIERCVNRMREVRISFSKKQWFLEALYEKLDRDEQKAKKLLEEKFKEDVSSN